MSRCCTSAETHDHPEGAAGFTDENLARLAQEFANTTGTNLCYLNVATYSISLRPELPFWMSPESATSLAGLFA